MTMLALAMLNRASLLLIVLSLSSLLVEGREGEEQDQVYYNELMMPLMLCPYVAFSY